MFPRISRPTQTLSVPIVALVTSAAVAAGTALVAAPAPASAAPPVRTAEPPEAVPPSVEEIAIPAVERPQSKKRSMSAQSEEPEHAEVVAATQQIETDTFSMLGVTWEPGTEATEIEAEVRVRNADGWTDWQHLHTHNDEVGGTPGTAPLWVGDADAVQARVLSSEESAPSGLQVALIDPGETATEPTPQPMSANGAAGGVRKPAIVSRRAWGADPRLRENCSNGRYTYTIRAAFVHHTVGSNHYSRSESDNLVRGVYAYHTQSRGWCDIGYNFLVDKYGRIFEGRYGGPNGEWLPVHGAHTGGYNENSFGVSLMGCFEPGAYPSSICDGTNPTPAMMNATARLIAWKLALNYRNPKGHPRINGRRFDTISGHRDTKSTACPGAEVYAKLPWLRDRVDALIETYDSPIYRKFRQLGASTGFVRAPFFGEHPSADGRGTVAHFHGADILHSPRTGAHEVHGAIRKRYRQLRSARGPLGFPVTDEKRTRVRGARNSVFQDGKIYWSRKTDANEVYGAILRRYKRVGSATGVLGLPTSGEKPARHPGSRHNNFEHGRIYWSKQSGAHEVYGAILRQYKRLKSASGRLALPTTGEYSVRGGRAQRFMGGQIRWDRSSGKTRVTFY